MEFEKLADPADEASRTEYQFLADALLSHKLAAQPHQMPQADGTYAITECVECGEDIGEGRLKAAIKNTLCIHCATLSERKV